MIYTKYLIENQCFFKEEATGYLSNTILNTFLLKEQDVVDFFQDKNREIITLKLYSIQLLEEALTTLLYEKKELKKEDKAMLMDVIAKLNTQKELVEILLSDNPEQGLLNLQAASARFAKKMQSSV